MNEIDAVMQRLNYELFETFADGQTLVPADEPRMARFEAMTGYRLPADYRLFLQKYGGAHFPNVVAEPPSFDPRLEPDFLFHVDHFSGFYNEVPRGTLHDLPYAYRLMKDQLPAGMIPIAESCGNWYCLSCKEGSTYSGVYLYMPDEFDEGAPENSFFLVAPSFLQFLKSLRKRTDQEMEQ